MGADEREKIMKLKLLHRSLKSSTTSLGSKSLAALALNTVLENLTEAMKHFEDITKQLGVSSDSNMWKVNPPHKDKQWLFECRSRITNERYAEIFSIRDANYEVREFGTLKAGLRVRSPVTIDFFIQMLPDSAKLVTKDVLDVTDFTMRLCEILLQHRGITSAMYESLRKTVPIIKNLDKITEALKVWIDASNYNKTTYAGKLLERLRSYIPEEFFKSPSNTLYRAVSITPKALEKLKRGEPVVLKNRRYSSWTYDPQAALAFGNTQLRGGTNPIVVLKKMFSSNEIFLNVYEFGLYLADRLKVYRHILDDEKEIAVKSASKDFKFTKNDIYRYLPGKGKWRKELAQKDLKSTLEESATETTSYFNYYYWNPAQPGDYETPTGLGASFKGKALLALLRRKDPVLAAKVAKLIAI